PARAAATVQARIEGHAAGNPLLAQKEGYGQTADHIGQPPHLRQPVPHRGGSEPGERRVLAQPRRLEPGLLFRGILRGPRRAAAKATIPLWYSGIRTETRLREDKEHHL